MWLDTRRGKRIPGFYISYRRQGGVESCRSLTADEIRDSQPEEGVTLLYSHANAEDLGSIYPWCKFLSKMLQVNLFAYDYCGYGMAYNQGTFKRRSNGSSLKRANVPVCLTGPPSEDHCYADIDAAYDYLRNTLHVPAQNIVLYGRSLGSGPSCYLATKTALKSSKDDPDDGPVGGLILHAPFLSVYRVVIDPGCTLYGDKFVNLDIIPMVKSPTILIHGTADQIVPFHHSERLFDALPKEYQARPLYIEGMSHNNVHAQVRPMFVDRLTDYLRDHVWPSVQVRKRTTASNMRSRIWKMVDEDGESEGDHHDDDRFAHAVEVR